MATARLMEFLPGAFESAWERRRADLHDELVGGRRPAAEADWDWRRRGNVTRLPVERRERLRSRKRATAGILGGSGFTATGERSMRARFEALARGSQPAVVKVSCYGPGSQAAPRLSYISRGGVLGLETETGERLAGKAALATLRAEWEELFCHRAATRDVGAFGLTIEAPAERNDDMGIDALARRILKSGLAERRFVYGVRQGLPGRFEIEGVVVLRDPAGNRLSGDDRAARRVQDLLDLDQTARSRNAVFWFHGHGNGVDNAAARLRSLLGRFDGQIIDESGRRIAAIDEASSLVRQTWRSEFHSRRGRDFMHLIISARAGTDTLGLKNVVRDFLGEQFAGHRYAFAVHDPADDPRRTADGGKRPHIHAHAIVTMRSEAGKSLNPYIADFRQWRLALAEKARQNGIAMEATDRRERASPPAFTRNQVRPIAYDGVTAHIGTSMAGQSRYDTKRADFAIIAASSSARLHAQRARDVWREIAASAADPQTARYAKNQADRIADALCEKVRGRAERPAAREVVGTEEAHRGEEKAMRQMTRPEFEAYEKRIEAILQDVHRSLGPAERDRFEEIAAAAREVVASRREYLHLRQEQERPSAPEERASPLQARRSSQAGERIAELTSRPLSPRPARDEQHTQPDIAHRSRTGRETRER